MSRAHHPAVRVLLNKVPEVTVWFWIIKILATTVGETAADLLAIRLDWGLVATSWVMGALCLAALAWQFRMRGYSPPPYWTAVVLISVVGTLISDNLVDGMGVSLMTTTSVFSLLLVLVFVAWYKSEGTLSVHTIYTRRRELFYWAAILCTFALGTSAGDLIAERLDMGYGPTLVLFAVLIAGVAAMGRIFPRLAILWFWTAYILTRPLGASLGDFLAKPHIAGGLGWGTITTSEIFFGLIVVLVTYLTLARPDRLPDEIIET